MTTDREPEVLPGGTPVDQRVGRLGPERANDGARLRPVCWYCNREIHPLDDMHHYWCHGGE